jgi:hypothetical protein
MAGVASSCSFNELLARIFGLSPSWTTEVSPPSLATYSLPSAMTGEAEKPLPSRSR